MGRDPAAPSTDEWECGECGALNPLSENICENCGFDQDGFPPEEDEDGLEEENLDDE